MSLEQLVKIGVLGKARGLKGELFINSLFPDWNRLKANTKIYLSKNLDDSTQPALLEYCHWKGSRPVIKLQECKDRTKAEMLTGMSLWTEVAELSDANSEDPSYSDLIGFDVYDGVFQLGKTIAFDLNSPQVLLKVETPRLSILEIPFVKPLIKEVQKQQKRILMELPPGLLELNQ
jgi:16S rRNA processing protein RimM